MPGRGIIYCEINLVFFYHFLSIEAEKLKQREENI